VHGHILCSELTASPVVGADGAALRAGGAGGLARQALERAACMRRVQEHWKDSRVAQKYA
jgi:hypothetical protein